MFTEVDFSKTYRIEPVPSKQYKELADKNLSSYPGTQVSITPSYDDTLKRYKNTGLDENDSDVLRLPKEEKEKARAWIKEKKEYLEAMIGQAGYLEPTSDAWLSNMAIVLIETTQDLKIKVNGHSNVLSPSTNHRDAIALLILMNDPEFPKSRKDLSDPKFRGAKFYITTDEEFDESLRDNKKKITTAHVKFAELFGDNPNPKRAWEVAYYMKIVYKQKINVEKLENDMYKLIFESGDRKMMNKFLEAVSMDNSDLLLNNLFNQAIAMGVVRFSKDQIYFRGSTNYRDSIEASVQYLKSAEMATELAGLREEVKKTAKKFENA